jgi:hypothetical protein
MRLPACVKDVQKLMGCLAAIRWFPPFFKLLRKYGPFVWTKEADEAFQELKRYLTSPPVMVAPEPDKPLLLYIEL